MKGSIFDTRITVTVLIVSVAALVVAVVALFR